MIRYIAGGAATASLVAFFGLYSDLPDADASGKAKRGEAAMMVVGGPPATGPDGVGAATGALSAPIEVAATPSDSAELFTSECGACHMAYPAALLPARSWQAIMGNLADHFGENASLDPDAATRISDYLLANAADAGGRQSNVLRGLAAGDVPLRITDTPWWKRQHDEVSRAAFKRADVKSASNCVACHGQGAARGVFEDD